MSDGRQTNGRALHTRTREETVLQFEIRNRESLSSPQNVPERENWQKKQCMSYRKYQSQPMALFTCRFLGLGRAQTYPSYPSRL
jgi:hypothetical protein